MFLNGKEVHIAKTYFTIQGWKGYENGRLSRRYLVQQYKIPKPNIKIIIQNYNNTGAIDNLEVRGRKLILTSRKIRTSE